MLLVVLVLSVVWCLLFAFLRGFRDQLPAFLVTLHICSQISMPSPLNRLISIANLLDVLIKEMCLDASHHHMDLYSQERVMQDLKETLHDAVFTGIM